MPWEKFKRPPRTGLPRADAFVAFFTAGAKGNRIANLSAAAYAALGEPERVVLGYDATANAVGFAAATPEDRGSYVVGGTGNTVSMAKFARHHGIPDAIFNGERHPATMEGKWLSVPLD